MKTGERPPDLAVVEWEGQKSGQSDGKMNGNEEINTAVVDKSGEKSGHEGKQKESQTTSKQAVTGSRSPLSVPNSMHHGPL